MYDKRKSSTWASADNAAALGLGNLVTTEDNNAGNFSFGIDKIELSANVTSLSGYPLALSKGTSTSEGFFQNALGLSDNSTILNSLASAGVLASKVWSIYDGWTGANSQNQSDGILVFGGYDAAKTASHNATIKFYDDAWDVTVTDMELRFSNGSKASLFKTVNACQFEIIPSYPYISLGDQIWSNFLTQTGSKEVSRSTSPLSWWQMIIAADTAFTGDLIMTMSSGLQITIPNHELIKPYVVIDANGLEVIQNSTTERLTAFYSLGSGYTCGVLGRAFLSSAYIMVDNDQKQFTLWQGQPSQEQKLVAVGGPSVCSGSALASTPTSSPAQATSSPSTSSPSISKNDIAGITVALISIIIGCIGIGFYLARRRTKQGECASISEDEKGNHSSLGSDASNFQKPELPSDLDHQPPQELALEQNPSNTMPPYEMTGNQGWASEMPEHKHPIVEMAGSERGFGGEVELPGVPKTPPPNRDFSDKGSLAEGPLKQEVHRLSPVTPRRTSETRPRPWPQIPHERRSWV